MSISSKVARKTNYDYKNMAAPNEFKKTIVLCFDEAQDSIESQEATNVSRLYSVLEKKDPHVQICFYQVCNLGKSHYYSNSIISPLLKMTKHIVDSVFPYYPYQDIIDGYQFLMNTWENGDLVYVFGFGSGACVARCLLHMVLKVGLLSAFNESLIAPAWNLYVRMDDDGIEQASKFKKTFSHDVIVDFLGIFDSVSSTCVIPTRKLPDVTAGGAKMVRHALALNKPYAYHSWNRNFSHLVVDTDKGVTGTSSTADVKEMRFYGFHEDIGGGNPTENSSIFSKRLSNSTLTWLVKEIPRSDKPGIVWNQSNFPWETFAEKVHSE